MSALQKGLAFLAALAVVAVVTLVNRGVDYIEDDPRLCTSCHTEIELGATGRTPSHAQQPCQSCHLTEKTVAAELWKANGIERSAQVLGENVVPHGTVRDATCAECHVREGDWHSVSATAGHQAHLKGEDPVRCTECHATAAHKGKPAGSTCTDCHDEQKITSSGMAQQHCLSCHQFLTATTSATPRDRWAQCDDCHGSTSLKALPVQLHAQMPCDVCHQPHREPFTVARGCEDCHDKVVHAHPEVDDTVYCTACHGPHDEWSLAPEKCAGCHEDQVFEALPEHAKEMGAAFDDEMAQVALAQQSAHATCIDCHKAHDREGSMVSKTCVDCHAQVDHPGRHQTTPCSDCHAPHRPLPRDCNDCHADLRVRHGRQACESCHSVHENPFAKKACTSCHKGVPTKGRKALAHAETSCERCHAPHRPQPRSCASCHKDVATAVKRTPAEHAKCESCHAPHTWKKDAKQCGECHEDETRVASTLEGHTDCAGCHPTHGLTVRTPRDCANCHEDQVRNTKKDHRECGDCHAPHDGSRDEAKPCASCHTAQSVWTSGQPKHAECEACHPVHKGAAFTQPSCSSCHEKEGRRPEGLHRIDGHADCDDCHTAHRSVDPSRSVCTSCHKDQVDHERDAKTCNGCHTFLKP